MDARAVTAQLQASRLGVIVQGLPAPQGSKKHVGHGVMVEASKRLPPWRQAIAAATTEAIAAQRFQADRTAPYQLSVVFTLARPASHWRSGKHSHELKPTAPAAPAVMPDLDKLLRALMDGLADGGALANDSRVVTIAACKAYPGGHLDALDSPGAVVLLRHNDIGG